LAVEPQKIEPKARAAATNAYTVRLMPVAQAPAKAVSHWKSSFLRQSSENAASKLESIRASLYTQVEKMHFD
jgi:hypothetical protein